MSFPTVYYIPHVIPSCYSAGYAMCVCVSFGACVYRSLDCIYMCLHIIVRVYLYNDSHESSWRQEGHPVVKIS